MWGEQRAASRRRPWFQSLGHVLWMLAGLASAVAVVVWFRRVLRANGVTWFGVR